MNFQLAIRKSRLLYSLRITPFGKRLLKSKKKNFVIGLMRVRNEELLMKDSLNHMAKNTDCIIVFDDCSTDNTYNIALSHPKVALVIKNRYWRKNRTLEETANRAVLLKEAQRFNGDWIFYCDADERFEGDIKKKLASVSQNIKGIRIKLVDAYITSGDKKPFTKGDSLYNFRKYFGPERRDIIMIWRNEPGVQYVLPDSREPTGIDEASIKTMFWCQHYGKSLSIDHWEETCNYYVDNFPQYAEKWQARKGKAVHKFSDFNTKLLTWDQVKKPGATIKIN